MRFLPSLSLCLLGSVPLFGTLLQDPPSPPPIPGGDEPEEEYELPPLLKYRQERRDAIVENLEGAWDLVRYIEEATVFQEGVVGFAMFSNGYMSLIITSFARDTSDNSELLMVQTGSYHYRISDLATLQTSTILGVDNYETGYPGFEPTGSAREFEVTVDETRLELRHPDGARLEFLRRPDPIFPERTILNLQRRSRHGGIVDDDYGRDY